MLLGIALLIAAGTSWVVLGAVIGTPPGAIFQSRRYRC